MPRKGWETRSSGRTSHPDKAVSFPPKPTPASSWWAEPMSREAFTQKAAKRFASAPAGEYTRPYWKDD
jgi:hypothetical protein